MNEEVQLMIEDGAPADVFLALKSLRPTAMYSVHGNEYSGIDWQDEIQLVPTQQEVIDEVESLRISIENIQYRQSRKTEYLPIKDQLDMLYWDRAHGTTTWDDHIAGVKAKYPKPE